MVKTIWLLGDRLLGAADNMQLMTVSQFKKFYNQNSAQKDDFVLRFGQGLSTEDVIMIKNLLKEHKYYEQIMNINNSYKNDEYLRLTHKNHLKNVMIGNLKEIVSEQIYYASLLIDDNCDEMQDHVTGSHLQGMVMLEAARQFVNAVTEQYLISDSYLNYGFVVNSIVSTYRNYVFPFSVDMIFRINSIKKTFDKNMRCRANIEFHQANKKVCDFIFDYSVYSKKYLNELEADKMKEAKNHYLMTSLENDVV